MSEALMLMLSAITGVLLGAIFFGGLWWTVRQGVSAKRPGLLFLGSLLLRTGAVLIGFYLISGGHAERVLVCLLGFVVAGVAAKRRVHSSAIEPRRPDLGTYHAP